jgi:hypothetical protein
LGWMLRVSRRLVSIARLDSLVSSDFSHWHDVLTPSFSDNFHPFLGPLLMITYALLSNTLLLTVLVAILGNTFATINADAVAEVSRMQVEQKTEV